MFVRFYPRVVRNVSGNFREPFRKLFCPVTNLSQLKLQRGYMSKKYNFTAVNTCFISTNPVKFPWGNFLWRKIPRKIFLTILSNFEILGKMLWNFINKKYNLPAVNKCYTLLSRSGSEGFRKPPGNFSETFLSRDQTCHNWTYKDLTCQKNTILRL